MTHPHFHDTRIQHPRCVLYQMCNADVLPLFQGNNEDNLSDDASKEDCLHGLYEWSFARKLKKLNKIFDPLARNLLSELLQKNPAHRPSISRILQHPFISKQVAPLGLSTII